MRIYLAASLIVLAACGGDGVSPNPPDSGLTDCTKGAPLTLAVGDVRALTASEKASLCVAGGSGSEYALVPVNTLGPVGKTLALTFTATNTTASGTALSVASADAPTMLFGDASSTGGARFTRNAAFDERLRGAEHALFTTSAATARATFDLAKAERGSGARFSVSAAALPSVGDLLTFNTQADLACTGPKPRGGRVVAITKNAIVVADTGNPTGGFTDLEYQNLGNSFDTLAYPVDTLNFGKPADIDANGDRAVIFFTRAVNDLTPANSETYVGGFFFGRDLYPKTTQGNIGGCAGSNYAEMFYMLVPDPARASGKTNSPFTKQNVADLTVSVLAHEFQHLINESRRLYVQRTAIDEATWLNEGLSHVAEELAFYRAAGIAPRSNIGATGLVSSRAVNGYNQFESSNISRVLDYLENTEGNSPLADNDSIATRGATWDLLRYAADRKGGTERDTWFALANSTDSGVVNLSRVFGTAAFSGTRPWLRDWAVSNFTDDAGFTVPDAYQQRSWNLRSFVPALRGSPPYPLVTRQLVAGTPVAVTLTGGGGASYLRFRVAASTTGRVETTSAAALPTTLDMALVRTR